MDVRGEPPLGFDGGEVLDVIAGEPAQVLNEPVKQRGEVQRVPGGPRRPRGRDGRSGHIKDMVMISQRPAEAEDRAVPGHWESQYFCQAAGVSALAGAVPDRWCGREASPTAW